VDRRRAPGAQKTTGKRGRQTVDAEASGMPPTDAVLNCPGCLSTLSVHCQRHSVYSNQYRAVFVLNCCVDHSYTLSCPPKLTKKEIWKNKKMERKRKKMQAKAGNNTEEDCENMQSEDLETASSSAQTLTDVSEGSAMETVKVHSTEGKNKRVRFEHSVDVSDGGNAATVGEVANSSQRNGGGGETELVLNGVQISVTSQGDTEKHTNFAGNGSNACAPIETESSTDIGKDEMDHESTPPKDGRPSEAAATTGNPAAEGSVPASILKAAEADAEDVFFSVSCSRCKAKVAVVDRDEVYHFFNVITSY